MVVGGGQAVSQGTIWLQHKRVFSGDQNAFLKNYRKIPLVQQFTEFYEYSSKFDFRPRISLPIKGLGEGEVEKGFYSQVVSVCPLVPCGPV